MHCYLGSALTDLYVGGHTGESRFTPLVHQCLLDGEAMGGPGFFIGFPNIFSPFLFQLCADAPIESAHEYPLVVLSFDCKLT